MSYQSIKDNISRIPQFGGKIYYVSADNGDDTNFDGISPYNPYATIGKAISMLDVGDAVNIMAGIYTENGLDLNVNASELWFEIGAQLSPTSGCALTVSANSCRVSCLNGILKINPVSGENGVEVTGDYAYLNEIRVDCDSSAEIGFDLQGDGIDVRRCRVSDPTVAAFKIQGDSIKLEGCCTGGNSSDTSIGYWATNSCDKFRLVDCSSQGHKSGGFIVDSGCTNGVIWKFSSGGGDGKWDRNGGTIVSDLTYEETKFATSTFDGSTTYNIFKVIGSIKVLNIFGYV